MAEFTLTDGQQNVKQIMHYIAESQVRPMAIQADLDKKYPDSFLLQLQQSGIHGGAIMDGEKADKKAEEDGAKEGKKKEGQTHRLSTIASEELAWGDPSLILSLPGPGLGGPPVKMMGTEEQKKRFFGPFKNLDEIHFGAYATTEPGCGSDVSAISTTARKENGHYVLNGRKCYITNGAKADWVVIFATIGLGVAIIISDGHRE